MSAMFTLQATVSDDAIAKVKQQAFMPLFRALPPEKRRELKHQLMLEDRPFTDWPKALGVEVDPYVLPHMVKALTP